LQDFTTSLYYYKVDWWWFIHTTFAIKKTAKSTNNHDSDLTRKKNFIFLDKRHMPGFIDKAPGNQRVTKLGWLQNGTGPGQFKGEVSSKITP
jgi:hypothetical protein